MVRTVDNFWVDDKNCGYHVGQLKELYVDTFLFDGIDTVDALIVFSRWQEILIVSSNIQEMVISFKIISVANWTIWETLFKEPFWSLTGILTKKFMTQVAVCLPPGHSNLLVTQTVLFLVVFLFSITDKAGQVERQLTA